MVWKYRAVLSQAAQVQRWEDDPFFLWQNLRTASKGYRTCRRSARSTLQVRNPAIQSSQCNTYGSALQTSEERLPALRESREEGPLLWSGVYLEGGEERATTA